MPPDEPSWWYREQSALAATALSPAAAAYGWITRTRFALARPYRSRLPVLCAGNFTAGGTGKTPLVLELCERVREIGKRPVVLTRGYGGRIAGPHHVRKDDTAADVGDEPLLLARAAPVVVARDRAAGARAIEAMTVAEAIVMDDGLQNPDLRKDLTLAVVDGARGLGNGRVIPAGPLRAPLSFQAGLADAIVVNEVARGAGDRVAEWLKRSFDGPVLRATTVPSEEASWLAGRQVVAWAGIGAPERFFAMLRRLGAELVESKPFPDHHRPTPAEAGSLLALASRTQALLVSTEKDLARITGASGQLAELAAATRVLKVRLVLSDQDSDRLAGLIAAAVKLPAR